MNKLSIISMMLVVMFSFCKKKNNPPPVEAAPENFTLSAVVNTDNSGNVTFTASAVNAVSYEYGFGNGAFQIVTSGTVTYKYPASGTYTVNVIAKSASGKTASKSIQVTVTVALSLVWSDEFNANGAPDPAKWGYDLGGGGWGNGELQYYTSRAENAVVQNGVLRINLIKENFSGSNYTSARLLSRGKFSFKYGTVEARAKLPAGGGTWPAIWMLGNNISTVSWPACGEIDIMEHVGNSLNRIHGTLHYPGRSGGNADGNSKLISNATTEFHLYKLEWTAAAIKIYVDNEIIHTVVNSNALPFNQEFFFILNVAMGGSFGGAVDPAVTNAAMEIDYVRVFQ
ncbi:MAG: family 16 glycosylhydrolase [Chitinophagaceae bacterium]|jgi:beta-glucanase (GH16 family)|nr:family 16 glycosylhydrolase [Chitinophagaceae bacterium]